MYSASQPSNTTSGMKVSARKGQFIATFNRNSRPFRGNPLAIGINLQSQSTGNPLPIATHLQSTCNCYPLELHFQSTGNGNPFAGQQQRQIKCSTPCARTHNAHCSEFIDKCHWHASCQQFSPMLQMRCMVAFTRELQRCVRCNMCHAAGAVRMQYFAVVHLYLLANT